ncbi:putative pentatricopeptide repeat-containing protein At3g01580 [Selaginella moellendorffii]|uniref:putative pentatricopeptide repeat-containing protein At3g01580 n=1 Tax=Selaginella moellendorffii TaxID=88036 RepID=UPI000D1C879B|nr:putative pentatricopeptide repeat-containing protein At3g01580 [Selaginella moellendorffii]|eukprot:XP_024537371.1 putative pentatricopeptide repeat-containing protein At3g01580 [Selaginella moellendorffii]
MRKRACLSRLWNLWCAYRDPGFTALEPAEVSLVVSALKGCGASKELELGKRIHSDAARDGCLAEDSIFVANSASHMYGKCGALLDAIAAFERMPVHSAASWNSLIVGYTENGRPGLALELFFRMVEGDRLSGSSEGRCDARTLVAAAMACSSLAVREEEAHQHGGDRIVKDTSLALAVKIESFALLDHRNTFVANSFVDMFAKCESLVDAFRIFEGMEQQGRDVVSWTALIMGCVENGRSELALELFSRMLDSSSCARPNARTYVAVIKACASLAAGEDGTKLSGKIVKVESLARGRAIHSQAEKGGWSSDLYVSTALLELYAFCGSLRDAEKVFEKMAVRDVVAWNSLLFGYVENGEAERALSAFSRMTSLGEEPDSRSFVAALMACSCLAANERGVQDSGKLVKLGCLEKAMALHSQASSTGAEKDLFVANTFVHLYAKCGSMEDCRRVFQGMEQHSVVSWNSLILGYVEAGETSLALETYVELRRQGRVFPNPRTFVAALMACGALAALCSGRRIHGELSRCGCCVDAKHIFDASSSRKSSLVAWSSLILGYSLHGNAEMVLELFQAMQVERVLPDGMVFSSVLGACSHAGLVEEGKKLFGVMKSRYGVEPDVDHYVCLVDLVGRAGFVEEAMAVVRAMPCGPTPMAWITILGACMKWKNLELGLIAFKSLAESSDEEDDLAAACVLMQNIFACICSNAGDRILPPCT